MSYTVLQHYWWAIISILGSVLAFLMFVQGGQTLIYTLGKTEDERTIIVNSLGRKWEFTFTTLVTFGGAFFASFPLFYSTSFGGAYWVWLAILFCFIIQAISYEFRSKPNNVFGHKTYEVFLFINGALGTFLIGTAIGTFFNGSQFSVNFANISNTGNPVISRWEVHSRGLEAALNIHNLSLGITVFFLARILGLLYFMNNIENEPVLVRARKQLLSNFIPFLAVFLFFVAWLLLKHGYGYHPETKVVSLVKYKYLHNFIEMPLVGLLFLAGTLLVLYGIIKSLLASYTKGIWFSGIGTVLVVFSLFAVAGYNHTAYYPSDFDLQSSLTIENSSSSRYTLTIMSYVSLLVPFVIAYIFYAWKSINDKKINLDEIKEESHVY
ncbi:MAG: cytochrome d ubiquinol oxidase subunit II [Bacteroidales bacterium]|nr:cytochrome d ubiquinol oxidase subunit II [Bacteroidales bacterium]